MSRQSELFTFLLFCLVLAPAVSIAEGPIKDGPVRLMVRTIAAYPEARKGPRIDARLKDISWKLESLPYKSFSLDSSRQIKVKMKKKRVLKLPDGQQLTLRLLYKNEKKLGIWIDWLDKAGMQLLNSKIHLGCSDPVLAGTDNPDGSASLLAIALSGKK
jgi:hypothetical protein